MEKLVDSSDPTEDRYLRGQIAVYNQWLRAADGIKGRSIVEEHYNQLLTPRPPTTLENLGTYCEEDSGQNY